MAVLSSDKHSIALPPLVYVLALTQFALPFMYSGVGVTLPSLGLELGTSGVGLGLIETVYLAAGSRISVAVRLRRPACGQAHALQRRIAGVRVRNPGHRLAAVNRFHRCRPGHTGNRVCVHGRDGDGHPFRGNALGRAGQGGRDLHGRRLLRAGCRTAGCRIHHDPTWLALGFLHYFHSAVRGLSGRGIGARRALGVLETESELAIHHSGHRRGAVTGLGQFDSRGATIGLPAPGRGNGRMCRVLRPGGA